MMSPINPVISFAIKLPSTMPVADPMKPAIALSVKNSASTWRRLAPKARRMPISERRWVTAMANVLWMRNSPTKSANRLVRFTMKE